MSVKIIIDEIGAEVLRDIQNPRTSSANTNSNSQPMSATNGFSTASNPFPRSCAPTSQFPQTVLSTITTQFPHQFPILAMPELIREATIDACYESKAPDALVASCALSAISLACQNFVDVERLPGLVGPSSLFVTIIANSGERKSHVDSLFTKPFRDYDDEQDKLKQERAAKHMAALDTWKIQLKATRSAIDKAEKNGMSVEALTRKLEELYANKPEEPYTRKCIVNDSTAAELKFKLRHPFSSIGIFSDEAKISFDSGLMKNLATLNKLWDAGTISVDRRTSESFRISNVRVTMSLGIQPDLFFKHFCGDNSEARPGGHLARHLVAYPISTMGERFITQPRSSYHYLSKFQARIAELLHLEHSAIEAGTHRRRVLRFALDAQQRWIDGFNLTERQIAPGAPLSSISDFVSKFGDNIARIAALFHFFEGNEGDEISLSTLLQAIDVGSWYFHEFQRIFPPPVPPLPQDQLDAIKLENWLVKNFIKHRCDWIDKSDMERYAAVRLVARLEPAITILMQRGLLTNITAPPPRGRKPKFQYGLNVPYFEQAAQLQATGLA